MNNIVYLFRNGLPKALTMSYDDGALADRKLLSIFNRYGIRGTFHVCSGFMESDRNYVPLAEIADVYAGHEIACHTRFHPFLERSPRMNMLQQILQDRSALEKYTSYPVRGMSWPMGTYDAEAKAAAAAAGIVYSRTVAATGRFGIPSDWLEWHPTAKHTDDIFSLAKRFLETNYPFQLFYLWGHASEFEFAKDPEMKWPRIERFCAEMSGNKEVWYATNLEIHDYVEACRRLEFSADLTMVRNPSAEPVWILVNGKTVKAEPGKLQNL